MPKDSKVKLTDQELKKHVAAIHIENRLSLLERKMANVLLLNAYPDLLTRETHRIRIADLAKLLGFESNDRDCLKQALLNLMSTVLTWNIIDAKGNEKIWRARPMLMSVDVDRNWCIYAYHQDLREKFFNPEIYSRINLSIQKKFTSGYALSLYENCLRYRSTGSTGWWSLEVFRKLMGVGDNDYYADFRRLNSKLVKPAVQQVNKTSDIFLAAETKADKRRVVAIRFLVKENPQMSFFPVKPRLALTAADNTEEGGKVHGLRARLLEFGLRSKEADHFLKEHDADFIKENLTIVADMLARGVIKTTLRAVILDALKTDYRPHKAPYEVEHNIQRCQQPSTQIAREEARKPAEQYERLRRQFDKQRLQCALDALSNEQRKALEECFETANQNNAIFRKYFKKGYQHPMVQGLFLGFASKTLLSEPTEAEFAEFVSHHQSQPES